MKCFLPCVFISSSVILVAVLVSQKWFCLHRGLWRQAFNGSRSATSKIEVKGRLVQKLERVETNTRTDGRTRPIGDQQPVRHVRLRRLHSRRRSDGRARRCRKRLVFHRHAERQRHVCHVLSATGSAIHIALAFSIRRRSVAVASLGISTKLLYVEPDDDRLRAGEPSRYVISQLGSTQPRILPGSPNRVTALLG